jgi:hypothetical protein
MNNVEHAEIGIPNNALVRCPMARSDFVRVNKCEACEHCCGLTHAYINPELPFARQYMLRCAYPIDREIAQLEEGGE